MVTEGDSRPDQTWIEVIVETDGEGAEAVSELFNRYGTGGAVESVDFGDDTDGADHKQVVTIKTYIPVGQEGIQARKRLEEGLWHLSQLYPLPPPVFRTLPYECWATAWREEFPILRIGQRLIIRPPWLEYYPLPHEVVVELEPGMAFGTGLHPTTRMCLLAVEELTEPGMRVLDLGTGSGILAIAAAMLGARYVLGLDTDPTAVRVARANVSANKVADRVQVKVGSLGDVKSDHWDLIFVNIVARIIMEMLEQGLARYLAPEGRLVAAGIIKEQAEGVERAFVSQGLTIGDLKQEGDWVTLIGHPRASSEGSRVSNRVSVLD